MIRWEGGGGTCWTVYISRWVQGCIWTVGGGISGWMGGWVPGWKLLRNEGTLKDEWTGCFFSTPLCSPSQMNCSIFMSSLWSPYILSFFFSVSVTLYLSLPSFSFHPSIILTTWVIAVALWFDWLMHSESPGRWSTTNRRQTEGQKEKKKEGEKRERGREREREAHW